LAEKRGDDRALGVDGTSSGEGSGDDGETHVDELDG
jgi:hypothetical protein